MGILVNSRRDEGWFGFGVSRLDREIAGDFWNVPQIGLWP
jgi:hypothetical protein